jgi:pimeloyl-ACP methyl ester carboxylesterase
MRVTIENVAGVSTRYLHHGSGKRGVLMLHGVGVSADSWLWNLDALGEGVLCVAPDMLGFGMTGEGDYRNGAPHDSIIDHLVALVDHLNLARILIVGSSFGSNIACHLLWRLEKARVGGLMLVGCGPSLNSVETLATVYEQSFANGIAAMRNPTLDVCRRRMNNLVADPNTVPEALLMLQLTLYATPGAADRYERRIRGIKDVDSLKCFDVTARTADILVPTKIIWGRHDLRGDLAQAQNCAARIPNCKFDIWEDCGHLPYLEQPSRFNESMRHFLDD